MTTNEAIESMLRNGVRQCVIVKTLGVSQGRVSGIAYRLRNPAVGKRVKKPPRELVEEVIRETAAYYRLPFEDVLAQDGRSSDKLTRARRAAMSRIQRESGCSGRGLAKVWGLSIRAVNESLRKHLGAYDAATVNRLAWAHGPERAAKIVAGEDDATNADIAAWRRVCAGAEPARPEPPATYQSDVSKWKGLGQ